MRLKYEPHVGNQRAVFDVSMLLHARERGEEMVVAWIWILPAFSLGKNRVSFSIFKNIKHIPGSANPQSNLPHPQPEPRDPKPEEIYTWQVLYARIARVIQRGAEGQFGKPLLNPIVAWAEHKVSSFFPFR